MALRDEIWVLYDFFLFFFLNVLGESSTELIY